jgi:hypothetical protein
MEVARVSGDIDSCKTLHDSRGSREETPIFAFLDFGV